MRKENEMTEIGNGAAGQGAAGVSRTATAGSFDAERAAESGDDPSVYGGAYDRQINDAYRAVTGRAPFLYSLDGDALFENYRRLYTENAKRAMQDTMGQAAGLTGGYGSSYGQAAGQQMYDEQMRHLNDKALELEQRAYGRWQDEGDRLLQNYRMLDRMGAAEQATRQYERAYADQKRENAYRQLAQQIMQTGHTPSEDELGAAGMSDEAAYKYLVAWMTSNPNTAYMMGAMTPEQYFQITGTVPPGYVPETGAESPAAGAWTGGGAYANAQGLTKEEIRGIQRALGVKDDGIWGPQTDAAYERMKTDAQRWAQALDGVSGAAPRR